MFRFAFRLIGLMGLIVGVAAVLAAAPDETAAVANGGWEEIGIGSASGGGISNASNYSSFPSLAIDSDGLPIIAWTEAYNNNSEIYIRRWNGSSWVEMGGSASKGGVSDNSGWSITPSLATDSYGLAVVAWVDDSGGTPNIYVRRWNGSAWVEMGSDSAAGGGISDISYFSGGPSLAVDANGMPVVAWVKSVDGGDSEIYVRRWNGVAWVELAGSASGGGISNDDSYSVNPSIKVAPNGAPFVAWVGNGDIYLRRWNGSAWVALGDSASGGGISKTGWSRDPSLAIAPNGEPIIAWQYIGNGSNIYLRRWNGSAWVELAGSASGNGINDHGTSYDPSLAIASDGAPIVAWEQSYRRIEIYARRWNGNAWIGVGASAYGGGISNLGRESRAPTLLSTSDGSVIVAWQTNKWVNYEIHGDEIYALRYQPCHLLTTRRDRQVAIPSTSLNQLSIFLPSILSPSPFVETEPNDNVNQANGPLCSGYAYTGLPEDRHDVYSLDAEAGLIAIGLANHAGQAVQLQLHHQTITSNPIAIDHNGADGYHINVPNAPAGRYYVVISTQTPDSGATTRYQLTPTFNMSR